LAEILKDINLAARAIREGKLVAFPTETVYGLGADALNPIAVARIFELKERPSFDPLIVHISNLSALYKLTDDPNPYISILAQKFWPGPLTMVLKKSKLVPDIVTSGLDTVGIRMPDSDIALQLIKTSNCPIAAPSANKFGKLSPTKAEHVIGHLSDVDYVIDGGQTTVGIESTIIALSENGFRLLRPGVITRGDIERYVPYDETHEEGDGVAAPGMMDAHYSPEKPLFLLSDVEGLKLQAQRGIYIQFRNAPPPGFDKVLEMAPGGDLKKYAVRMFSVIHDLQLRNIDFILVEDLPEEGVGIAIMDRLRKASFNHKASVSRFLHK
jgi:L-threonylcarbamoyladenylate synthase